MGKPMRREEEAELDDRLLKKKSICFVVCPASTILSRILIWRFSVSS
jgi:hypothetical protein